MFRWLEKRSYSALIKQRLAQEGLQNFYPASLVNDVSDLGLIETERHAKMMHLCGEHFGNDQFEAHYGKVIDPLLKLMVINGKFERSVAAPGSSAVKVIEVFRKHFGRGQAALMGLSSDGADLAEELLKKHGAKSHLDELRPILFGP